MKWHNVLRDKLPADKQEVLLSVEGVNYIATFDAEAKTFIYEDELRQTYFKIGFKTFYWTEYTRPDQP